MGLLPATMTDDERWHMWHDGVRCDGMRQDGARCENVARKDTALCYWHTPGRRQTVRDERRVALAVTDSVVNRTHVGDADRDIRAVRQNRLRIEPDLEAQLGRDMTEPVVL